MFYNVCGISLIKCNQGVYGHAADDYHAMLSPMERKTNPASIVSDADLPPPRPP